MKRINTIVKSTLLIMLMLSAINLMAQTWPKYIVKAKNDTLINSKQYQFDVYIYEDPATTVPLNLNTYQFSFNILNTAAILNGGTLSGAYISGTSQLTDGVHNFYPSGLSILYSGGYALPRVNGAYSPSAYMHIPQSGLRVGTFRITNTVDFGISTMNMTWWNSSPAYTSVIVLLGSPPSVPSVTISPLPDTVPSCHMTFFTNPILNKPLTIYNMTGGGYYCTGGPGVIVGLSGSEVGVVYELLNNGVPTGISLMGTGAPLSFGYQPSGTYTCLAYRDATYITNTMNGSAISTIGTPLPVITGHDSVCPGATHEVYTTAGGKTSYVWTVVGGTVVSGGGSTDSTITIHWGSTPPASVSVNYIDAGCSVPSSTAVFTVALTSVSSTPPTGISATFNPICTGNSTTLTVSGGSLGTGAAWKWYSGTCGGTSAGTGQSVSVTPSASTTYYVRAEGNCNATSCDSLNIAVTASLPVSVSISANPPGTVCAGANVTFTATPVNGGTTPVYQWYDNSTPVGGNSAVYSTTSLVNGHIITCKVTSSESCATGNPATSNPLTMTVVASLPVSVSIAASPSGPVCSGHSVTFTATPVNGGSGPSYQWKVNNNPAGTNSSTFTTSSLANGDAVTCVLTSNATPCVSGNPATSNTITMTVFSNLVVNVNISANPAGPVCAGTNVTFTASPVNGGSNPVYVWMVNGNVAGTNSSTYSSSTLANGDAITCTMTSNATPCITGSPATSNVITMTVNPNLPVSISIAVSPTGAVCQGTNVTFTATPVNGGTSPVYHWYNGVTPVGTNSPAYSSSGLTDGSVITCTLTSSELCNTGNPATSNAITMSIITNLAVGVSISASPSGAICAGQSVTFTASPVNGGPAPSYLWKVNNIAAGTNSSTFTSSTLLNGDVVTCVMTSNATPCISGNPATSNPITMTVNANLPVSVSITVNPPGPVCDGTGVTFTASPVNGGSSPVYVWKVNGNVAGTNSNIYSSSTLLNGDAVTCVMTSNATPCISGSPATSNTISMTVNPNQPVSVSISANPSGAICPGTNVTFTAAPVNGGSNPAYQWYVNSSPAGSNSNTYSTSGLLNGDVVTCQLTSNITPCATGNPAISNPVTMTVNPTVPVSVSISCDPLGSICSGTSVTFTATPVNGGTLPAFQWYVNGSPVGTNSDTLTRSGLSDGDVITCRLTSNAPGCITGNPAQSNSIIMSVMPLLPVSIVITASATSICPGSNVTFTASTINGGTSPAYKWTLNGMAVGGDSSTYTNNTLANGDKISCEFASDELCTSGNPAFSDTITMTVSLSLVAGVSISVPSTSVCQGEPLVFTAVPVDGGSFPVYHWYKGITPVGTNSDTYTTSSLANGDVITCQMTSSEPCATGNPATSNAITMTVNPNLPVSVSITALPAGAICQGSSVTFTAAQVNGGSGPAYQWYVNGAPAGTDSSNYSTSGLSNGDVITCQMTSSETCVTGNPATSNAITMIVNPNLPVSVNITANPAGAICQGISVTFTATPVNGGSSPIYKWFVNGSPVGSNSSTYSITGLANGDIVSCQLTSNATPCITGNPATSNTITMTVNTNLPVSISITANPTGAICQGSGVIYTAIPANGGSSPIYKWFVNGSPVGSNSSTYSTTGLANGDIVSCQLTSNATPCITGNPAISNAITMTVNPLPVVHLGNDTIICTNYSITLNAGTGFSSYTWSDGSHNQTDVLSGSALGIGTTSESVQVSNSFGCYSSDTILITVSPCTGIKEIRGNLQISCYPNPVHGILNVAVEGIQEDETEFMLISSFGQMVYREKISGGTENYIKKLDMAGFSKGVYYLQINAGDKVYVQKIIVD